MPDWNWTDLMDLVRYLFGGFFIPLAVPVAVAVGTAIYEEAKRQEAKK